MTTARLPRAAGAALAVWPALAIGLSASGRLERAPASAVPLLSVVLTGLVLVAHWRWAAIRAAFDSLDPRWIAAFHTVRLPVGGYFLYLLGAGALPPVLAMPGGWGNILVGGLAVLVAVLAPRRGLAGWWSYYLWNALGLADIVIVMIVGARLGASDAPAVAPFQRLPLSLLPTWLLPLIVSSHLLLMVRLRTRRALGSEWF